MVVDGYLVIFGSAPLALSVVLTKPARDDGGPLARVSLVRGDVVDAAVVVLVVIPVKVSFEVGDGVAVIAEASGPIDGVGRWCEPAGLVTD